ncbi:MAG: HlyD family efflux transporter periplasmic adaptor subunit [Phycisphaeraceae bacterium]|nr:HlyD family efflux transporter periplasmic adaptor subunit [Phycisphaeraceae bacterium]
MARTIRRILLLALALAGALAITWALWPRPAEVELATITRGQLRVTVDEDGRTRIKERYVVSAPLAGRLARVTLREGDRVTAGQTVLASIQPQDPSLLDPRALAEAQARVRAAQAGLDRAGAAVVAADAALELAQSDLARLREAQRDGAAVDAELDRASATEVIRTQERQSAAFARDIARFELEQAQAALLHASPDAPAPADPPGAARFEILAPVSGRVLRVIQESAAVVQAGTPLIEVGDPSDLEVIVDVLSSDAVAIRPGAHVGIERWGGDAPLEGQVRLVEPAAFTKVSALGVEEQRVNVVIDLTDPPGDRAGLGDGFRIEARIVVWDEPDVLLAPTSALFRHATSWAVFVVEGGRADVRDVTIGRRNDEFAALMQGPHEGERVVVYPGDDVREGVRVVERR